MNQIVVAIHFTMIGSEQDDGPVRFSSGFNFLENLADLIVDQCYFSRVIGPQLSRVVDLFVGGFREFSIEFAGGASAGRQPFKSSATIWAGSSLLTSMFGNAR